MNQNAGCFGKKKSKIYIPIANLIKKKGKTQTCKLRKD